MLRETGRIKLERTEHVFGSVSACDQGPQEGIPSSNLNPDRSSPVWAFLAPPPSLKSRTSVLSQHWYSTIHGCYHKYRLAASRTTLNSHIWSFAEIILYAEGGSHVRESLRGTSALTWKEEWTQRVSQQSIRPLLCALVSFISVLSLRKDIIPRFASKTIFKDLDNCHKSCPVPLYQGATRRLDFWAAILFLTEYAFAKPPVRRLELDIGIFLWTLVSTKSGYYQSGFQSGGKGLYCIKNFAFDSAASHRYGLVITMILW